MKLSEEDIKMIHEIVDKLGVNLKSVKYKGVTLKRIIRGLETENTKPDLKTVEHVLNNLKKEKNHYKPVKAAKEMSEPKEIPEAKEMSKEMSKEMPKEKTKEKPKETKVAKKREPTAWQKHVAATRKKLGAGVMPQEVFKKAKATYKSTSKASK